MLSHFCCAHDRWNRINQHAGFTRCDAREVFAHHARRRVGFDDGCAGNAAGSLGSFDNRIVRTRGDAVTTSSAAGKKLVLVDGTGWTENRDRSRDRFAPQVRRRDWVNVDAADTPRLYFRRCFFFRLRVSHHQRCELVRWNEFPQTTLQKIASALVGLGTCEEEL